MNFLTKTIGNLASITGNSIPYTFEDKIVSDLITDPIRSTSVYNLYNGYSNKDNKALVSIFEFNLKIDKNLRYLKYVKNGLKKLKSLNLLPGIVKLIEIIENDSFIYIITERVKPLQDLIDFDYPESKCMNYEVLMLGIYQLTTCLKFINNEGNSIFLNLNRDSIYINEIGEWKLFNFEYCISYNDLNNDLSNLFNYSSYQQQSEDLPSFKNLKKPLEFTNNQSNLFNYYSKLSSNQFIKFDSFELGNLIIDLFTELKFDIPNNLLVNLKKLTNNSITVRSSIENFLKIGTNSFFSLNLIDLNKKLDEIEFNSNLIENIELLIRFNTELKDSLPIGYFKFKILPNLINFYRKLNQANDPNLNEFKSILLNIIVSNLNEQNSLIIKPIVFESFKYNDRSIRMILLNNFNLILEFLTDYEVQDKIFDNLINGLNDTNDLIRETTILKVFGILKKLNSRQLNNDLLRMLAKLQNDSSVLIRINTIKILIKIASSINSNSRSNVLITAFAKSLKDPFKPIRLLSILSFKHCIELFDLNSICNRVLGVISVALLDDSKVIRTEAESIFELYLNKIKNEITDNDNTKNDDDKQEKFNEEFNSDLGKLCNLNDIDTVDSIENNSITSNLMSSFSLFNFSNSSSTHMKLNSSSSNINSRDTTPPPVTTTSFHQQTQVPQQTKQQDEWSVDFEDDGTKNDDDDGWGFDEDVTAASQKFMVNKPISKPTSKSTLTPASKPTPKPIVKTKPAPKPLQTRPSAHGGLKLKPKSKLQLNLEKMDDGEDDSWGDGW